MPILKNNKFLILLLVILSFLSVTIVLSADKNINFLANLGDNAIFNGQLGIGTTDPRAGLDVASSSIFSGATTLSLLGGQGANAVVVADNLGTLSAVPANSFSPQVSAADVDIGVFGANIRVGNYAFPSSVGIGVNTTTGLAARLAIKAAGFSSGTASLGVVDSLSEPLFLVRDDGSVGIGTTSPRVELEVQGDIINTGAHAVMGSLHIGSGTGATIDSCFPGESGWVCPNNQDYNFNYGLNYIFNQAGIGIGGYIWPKGGYKAADGSLGVTSAGAGVVTSMGVEEGLVTSISKTVGGNYGAAASVPTNITVSGGIVTAMTRTVGVANAAAGTPSAITTVGGVVTAITKTTASKTITVKGSAGTNCDIVFTNGLYVSTTCP